MSTTTSSELDLKSIENRITKLYQFRDEYFLLVPKEKYGDKQNIINDKSMEILKELNLIQNENFEDKATYFFLKGWLLNIKETYDPDAYESLTKSIKFNPENKEAWLQLGECYFKKGNLESALNCFQKVLKINPNDNKALRNSSIILRSIGSTDEKQKHNNIMESIKLAKKAVECDLEDKNSWAILGNAYLTLLFMIDGRRDENRLIDKCKTAYQKAIHDQIIKTKSDVLFNYSSLLQYDEDFEQSIKCLTDAYIYEPSWNELKDRKEHLIDFFKEISFTKSDQTVIKRKKLNSIKDYLKCEERKLKSNYGKNDKLFNGQTKLIEDLKEGFNDCLLVCKIISYASDNHNIFFCPVFYAIDSNGHTIILLIYNVVKNKGIRPGDVLVIIRPFLKEYQINIENNNLLKFKAIRIVDPLNELLVNNDRINRNYLSTPIVNVTLKSD